MRESNFAFPAQNRACVCISSQLYDRRALDTTSPLPLFNSLTHLTYLTSTSPRIREILTMDGGLERLVRLLRDFCSHPPPPELPSQFYGLLPPSHAHSAHTPSHTHNLLTPHDPKRPFDRPAAYRFSLAFQCVVNIGVRGSEPIRARVVQAGTLDIVGCVLEAWLASKGFAVVPSASASGMPRETREQRHARRQEMRGRVQAMELARALGRVEQGATRAEEDEDMNPNPTPPDERDLTTTFISDATSEAYISTSFLPPSSSSESSPHPTDTSNDTSPTSTPHGSSTPTRTVVVPGRDRSGTVVARRDSTNEPTPHARRRSTVRASAAPSESEPDAEMEDASAEEGASGSSSPSTARPHQHQSIAHPPQHQHASLPPPQNPPHDDQRRTVGIVGDDDATALDMLVGVGGAGMGVNGDGFVALDQGVGDDLAMGAPPGAPGNMNMNLDMGVRMGMDEERREVEDLTPRAGLVSLPDTQPHAHTPHPPHANTRPPPAARAQPPQPLPPAPSTSHTHGHHTHTDSGPYREEDVLLSLQLLAYLSKYPHVRQAFYKPREVFNPALTAPVTTVKESGSSGGGGFLRALAGATVGRGKDKDKDKDKNRMANAATSTSTTSARQRPLTQSTNVFSLVERFTFRPSPNETLLPSPPPFLPPEIQYWAGVIMRNACRKDESRGGIRQCANMLCGKWESFPREFAKCRRCRKAKYCGKECQSRAWAEGHRFWCSAREEEEGEGEGPAGGNAVDAAGGLGESAVAAVSAARPRARPTMSERPAPPAAAPPGPSRAAARLAAPPFPLQLRVPGSGPEGPRHRVNALPPHPGPAVIQGHVPPPYLHMQPGGVNARRRAGTMPGPSVSTADLAGRRGNDTRGGAGEDIVMG